MKRLVILITVSSTLLAYNVHAQQNYQFKDGRFPTVSIDADVQADKTNEKSIRQDSDINIFGGIQAGSRNSYNIQQSGEVNSTRIRQRQSSQARRDRYRDR
ncbi:hypothetical protein [Candidatus Marithrix sp. Canyon 246]|uniref:hypothetical protein n=1 Tax=Candidatus Marithrix sp. Canyon 246 TaxID=1827136 RepID=UPI000849F8A6|nr:hypothetical protein [Candidatus Marithrix sp. Canyon 246]